MKDKLYINMIYRITIVGNGLASSTFVEGQDWVEIGKKIDKILKKGEQILAIDFVKGGNER